MEIRMLNAFFSGVSAIGSAALLVKYLNGGPGIYFVGAAFFGGSAVLNFILALGIEENK